MNCSAVTTLLLVEAPDCHICGRLLRIMTKEIVALKIADDTVNKGRKGYDKDPLFVAKAVTPVVHGAQEPGCLLCCLQFYAARSDPG